MEPLISEFATVRVTTQTGVERYGLADLRFEDDWGCAVFAIHCDHWVMVRLSIRFDRPIHPRGEFMLKGRAPAPDCRLIRHISLAIVADAGCSSFHPFYHSGSQINCFLRHAISARRNSD